MYTLLATLAAVVVLLFGTSVSLGFFRPRWHLAAAMSAAFFCFSLYVIVSTADPVGFWTDHTLDAWGNQIWFDLLLAASVAFVSLLPRARALGMRPLPWFLAIVATGSIALCAFAARIAYLEDRSAGSAG
jgi:hypothetical protein